MIAQRHEFPNREVLAIDLAQAVASKLSSAVTRKGHAVLAVSGGTTPARLFQLLSRQQITWEKVTITVVDERQVPEDHPRSNARLVREILMRRAAAAACFVSLADRAEAARLPPFDVVILGMGNDGHTASYFPGGDTLAAAIDPHTDQAVIEISAPGSGEPRLTFTLPALLCADFLALHIEGQDKRDVLARAECPGAVEDMPVRAILNAAAKAHLYWCP